MDEGPGGGASRSTEPASGTSAATDVSLREHFAELRRADERFQEERDRRYTEVAIEREKALQIANEARKDALQLARDIQVYKDEKANELREQISSERGLYATKDDLAAAVREVLANVKQSGKDRRDGLSDNVKIGLALAAIIVTILVANHTFG